MKKVTFNLKFSLNEKDELCIPIDETLANLRVVEASLKVQPSTLLAKVVTAKYILDDNSSWEIDNLVNLSSDKFFVINISDELQNTIDNSNQFLILKFENATFENNKDCSLTVEYIPLVEYQQNNTKSIDLKNSCSATVNLASGELSFNSPLIPNYNFALPLSLNASYYKYTANQIKDTGMPKNWKLNVQQYLIKNDDKEKLSFTYIDGNGKEQIIEETYYYTDNENQKINIGRKELNVNLDGKIQFGENKILKKFNSDDLEKYKVFDSSRNIAQVVEKVKEYKNHPYIFSLNLNIENEIIEYRCNKIKIETIERKVKIYTGNQMVLKISSHKADIVYLTFKKDDDIITLVIDSDPTDSNTLKLYTDIIIAIPLSTDNSPTSINYYTFNSSLENIKSVDLKLNNIKISSSLNSTTNLKVVSSIAKIKGSTLVDCEPKELVETKQQITQLKDSISNLEDSLSYNNQQLILLAISKKYLEKQNEIQKRNIIAEEYQTLLQQVAYINRKVPNRDIKNSNTNLRKLKLLLNKEGLNYDFLKKILDYKLHPSSSKLVLYTVNDTEELSLSSQEVDDLIYIIYNEFADISLLGFTYNIDAGSTLCLRKENNDYSKIIYDNNITFEELYWYVKAYIGDQISDQAIQEFYSHNHDFTLSLKDVISINSQIETLKKTNFSYEDKLKTYREQLAKYNVHKQELEMQVPVYYLYDDKNTIYGFGIVKKWNNERNELEDSNMYRLILITDHYGNSISINYQSPDINRIVNIVNTSGTNISFNYNQNGQLKFIIDSSGRNVEFGIDADNTLKFIKHIDDKKSFFYDNIENFIILDNYGIGAKFDYVSSNTNIKKVETITYLSALDKIINGKAIYKDDFNKDHPEYNKNYELADNKITFKYNNYKSTTITTKLPQQESKITTYLFDKFGNITTIYENGFSKAKEDNLVKICIYTYQNNKLSSKMKNLLYSTDYLADVCFKENQTVISNAVHFSNTTNIDSNTTKFHSLKAGNEKAIISLSTIMLEKLKNDNQYKNNTYLVSGWAKADSSFILTDENVEDYPNYDQKRKFAIEVSVKYRNKTEAEPLISKTFDWRNTQLQYCSVPITLKSIQEIESITCYINYSNNTGNIIFSNLSFKEADWKTSELINENDSKVLVKDSAHSNWLTKTYFDPENNLPLKDVYVNKLTGKELDSFTTYQYTKQGKLLQAIDYNGKVKENVYNEKGTIVKSITYHIDEPATKIFIEQKLDEKNNIIGNVNELGDDTSTYEYIEGSNIISTKLNKDGTKQSFGYDQSGSLLEVCTTINGVKNSNAYSYVNNLLTSLKHNEFEFQYDYDDNGRIIQINIVDGENSYMYLKKEYTDFEEITTLGNNEIFRQTFDKNGNLIDTFYKKNSTAFEEQLLQNLYDAYGNLILVRDLKDGEKLYKIFLNKFGNNYKEESTQHESTIIVENLFDDSYTNISITNLIIDAEKFNYHYEYSPYRPDSQLKEIKLLNKENNCILNQSFKYDKLGRLSNINTNNISSFYSYLQSGERTTNLISKLQFAVNNKTKENLTYSYDEKGNIIEIRSNNELLARYFYDGLSRIIREDNKTLNKTNIFSYDEGGNILERIEFPFSLIENLDALLGKVFKYSYSSCGWKDQLMEFNGSEFSYDEIGNPKIFKNFNLSWSHGRQLDNFDNIASFKYNANGIRISKTANGLITKYYLNKTNVISQKDASNTFTFYYGSDGITGFHLKNDVVDEDYFYKKNIQNDIIGIYSTDGTQIAQYTYDACGNQKIEYLQNMVQNSNNIAKFVELPTAFKFNDTSNINAFIAFKNPFRYRSYYYDYETNLYYLNGRYYDPEIGRFINADDITSLETPPISQNGINLFTYCLNNPVMKL